MKYLLHSLVTAYSLLVSAPALSAIIDAGVVGNISVYDSNGDLGFESISSTSSLRVHWRNVNFLNQRWAYRSVLEIDLSGVSAGAIIDSAILTIKPTQSGTSAGNPTFDFLGYAGDGVASLSDADAGDVTVQAVTISSLDEFQVDFSSYLQTLVDAGESFLGVNIRSVDEGRTNNSYDEEFRSNGVQTGTALLPGPRFSVSFHTAPLPGSALLMLAGLLALTRLRPRKCLRDDLAHRSTFAG